MEISTTAGIDGPMKGLRVLDWTMYQFGPVAASMLGDMGADVIKIEAPDGDVGRAVARMSSRPIALAGDRNAYFETCNRNKRGIAVDLKTAEGRDIIYKLVEDADVFIENYRKGIPERLGMGYETLRKINPRLIYGSGSGYGPVGPDSAKPSLDGCGQARSGLMVAATGPSATEPSYISGAVSDQMGGIILCLGVVSALHARGQTGRRAARRCVPPQQHHVAARPRGQYADALRLPLRPDGQEEPHESAGERLRMRGRPVDTVHERPVPTILARLRRGAGTRKPH